MDLTPYEEDDDETLHRKLVAAKVARKRAEEDLRQEAEPTGPPGQRRPVDRLGRQDRHGQDER